MAEILVTVCHSDGRTQEKTLQIARVANLGMAGRKMHKEENKGEKLARLERSGVSVPEKLPTVGPKPNNLVTTDNVIQVNSTNTAGETEFILFPTEETVYVGVGNDHKDFDIAEEQVHKANSTCPSVMSSDVWELGDIEDHWDRLKLRSWVEVDGNLQPHQQASLAAFIEPRTLIDLVAEKISSPVTGTAIWSGTIASGEVDPFPDIVSAPFYLVQLYDPVLKRRLTTTYQVDVNNWVKAEDIT